MESKPLSAEELNKKAQGIGSKISAAKQRKEDAPAFALMAIQAQLSAAAALVAAIDRNTAALKDLQFIVQHPVTIVERERGDIE